MPTAAIEAQYVAFFSKSSTLSKHAIFILFFSSVALEPSFLSLLTPCHHRALSNSQSWGAKIKTTRNTAKNGNRRHVFYQAAGLCMSTRTQI